MNMEKVVKVEPYGIIQLCDKCTIGEMLSTGEISYAPKNIRIEHKCDKCGFLEYYKDEYPKVKFRRMRD